MDTPVIETARLILRAHRPADLADSLALWSNPVVTRFIGGRPLSSEDVWQRLLRYAGSWAMLGYGFWRIELRETGESVGEVGFHELKRDTLPSYAGVPEVGWVLLPAFHGTGMAREALNAALAWGDATIASDCSVCMIDPANLASLRLAAAVGYLSSGTVAYRGNTMQLFNRPRLKA